MNRYFIDTNYFLRFLLKDNESQFQIVFNLFQKGLDGEAKLFTSTVVIFEIYWVLSSFYKNSKDEVLITLEKILNLEFIDVENREILQSALMIFKEESLDIEDCYNLEFAKSKEANYFATFDKKLQRCF